MEPSDIKMDESQDGEYFTSYEDLDVGEPYKNILQHLFTVYKNKNLQIF